jgi:hypothetical protein
VGNRRSIRPLAQQQPSDRGRSRVKRKGKTTKSKSFPEEKDKSPKPSSGDCVNRQAHVSLLRETRGRKSGGSTGCMEDAQHAPSETLRSSRVRMEAWRQWLGGRRKPLFNEAQLEST